MGDERNRTRHVDSRGKKNAVDVILRSVFLLPAFAVECALVTFTLISRGALHVIPARLTIH